MFLRLPLAPQELEPVLGDLCKRLELTPQDLAITDSLADDYLEWVASTGIDVVDLRPVFRAQRELPYWRRDWHVDLEGHREIARALLERF